MRKRGQVVVLAALTLLLMALTMAFSFSMSNMIHERIRIQSQADAQAYSLATLEARGLNIMVYTNRTIAALVVTNMSVHAWHAIGTETVSILEAGEQSMNSVVQDELACCALGGLRSPPDVSCCEDAREARAIAAQFGSEAARYRSAVEDAEGDFEETVSLLNQAAAALHVKQKQVLENVWSEVGEPQRSKGVLKTLRERNAPRSEYVDGIHEVNQREFACAVEGWDRDDECRTLLGMSRPKMTVYQRSALIADVANASRGRFQVYCNQGNCEQVGAQDFQPNSRYLMGILGNEGGICFGFDGTAAVTRRDHSLPPLNNWPARAIGAKTSGHLAIGWRQGKGHFPLQSLAFSDDQGGAHAPAHRGTHNSFRGIQLFEESEGSSTYEICPRNVSCFINFRGVDPDKDMLDASGRALRVASVDDLDRGLPSAWGAVTQDLSLMRTNRRGPWELNNDGKLTVAWGGEKPATLTLRAGQGVAVSKAKVYFHELGNPFPPSPNMFDPFFRAKLERFRCAELKEMLKRAGDKHGFELVDQYKAPIEGQPQTSGGCSNEEDE